MFEDVDNINYPLSALLARETWIILKPVTEFFNFMRVISDEISVRNLKWKNIETVSNALKIL